MSPRNIAGSSSEVCQPGTPVSLVTISRLLGATVLPPRRCASVAGSTVKNVWMGGLKSGAWNVLSACCGTDGGMPPRPCGGSEAQDAGDDADQFANTYDFSSR